MESQQIILLDTGVLGKICNPKIDNNTKKILDFIKEKENLDLIIPEICDYELRRNIILENLDKSIRKLNKFRKE